MKFIIGVGYENNVANSIAVYDIKADKLDFYTTKKAKDLGKAHRLVVSNANLGFFTNKIDFLIGEQKDYPIIFKNGDSYTIENALLICDPEPKSKQYECLFILNNKISQKLLTSDQIKSQYGNSNFKYNFFFDKNGKLVVKVKGKADVVEEEDETEIDAILKGNWYEVDNIKQMIPKKKCPDNIKTFSADGILIVDGFKQSNIKEVDLSGVEHINAYAFDGCQELEKVKLSKSLKTIGRYAFRNCPKLKFIDIPESVEKLDTHIYDNGEVNLNKQYKDLVSPFFNCKITMFGKAVKSEKGTTVETLKVAIKESRGSLAILEIDPSNGKTSKKVIKSNEVSPLDIIINYDNKVLPGKVIIAGKTGNEYVCIVNGTTLVVKDFNELKNSDISDGDILGEEIIPKKPEWGWNFINMADSDTYKTSSKLGSEIAEIADGSNILSDEKKMIISDYITKKCISSLGKFTIRNIKKKELVDTEKEKYDGYTWRFKGIFYGGLEDCDNPIRHYNSDGSPKTKDINGYRYCYFGHRTINHWAAEGVLNGKVMKTFTFGRDCAQDFLGMSDADMLKLSAFEGIMSSAVKEITTIIKSNKIKEHIASNRIFYEVLDRIIKGNYSDIGFYTRLCLRCVSLNPIMPIPEVIRKDAINELITVNSKGSTTLDYFKIEKLLSFLTGNTETIQTIFNFPLVEVENAETETTCNKIAQKLTYFLNKGMINPSRVIDFKSVKDMTAYVNKLKFNKEALKECTKVRAEFDKLGLKPGKYVLAERFLVDTQRAEIYAASAGKYEDMNCICTLKSPISKENFDLISGLDKNDIRSSTLFDTTDRNCYANERFKREKNMSMTYKILNELLEPTKLTDNNYIYIVEKDYAGRPSLFGMAFKDNILVWFSGNASKPCRLMKEGALNISETYGLKEMFSGTYSRYFSSDALLRKLSSESKLYFCDIVGEDTDTFFNEKDEYKGGKSGLKAVITRDLEKIKNANIGDKEAQLFNTYKKGKVKENVIKSFEEECVNNTFYRGYVGKLNFANSNEYQLYNKDNKLVYSKNKDKIFEDKDIDWTEFSLSSLSSDKIKYYKYDDSLFSVDSYVISHYRHSDEDRVSFNKDKSVLEWTDENNNVFINDKQVYDHGTGDFFPKAYKGHDYNDIEDGYDIPDNIKRDYKSIRAFVDNFEKIEAELEAKKKEKELKEEQEKIEKIKAENAPLVKKYKVLIDNFDTIDEWDKNTFADSHKSAISKLINNQLLFGNDQKQLEFAMSVYNKYQKYGTSDKDEINAKATASADMSIIQPMIDDLDKIDEWDKNKFAYLHKKFLTKLKNKENLSEDQLKVLTRYAIKDYQAWKNKP